MFEFSIFFHDLFILILECLDQFGRHVYGGHDAADAGDYLVPLSDGHSCYCACPSQYCCVVVNHHISKNFPGALFILRTSFRPCQ